MFYLDRNKELTVERIIKFIQAFKGNDLPVLESYKDYYDGHQKIIYKTVNDASKPCNKLVANYCYDIVENYNGYLTGVPISYTSKDDITDLINILKYNDYHTEDSNLLKNALIYGVSFELNYLDEEAQQRFKLLDSTQCIPIYSNDLSEELIAVIRFYSANDIEDTTLTYVDVYTDREIRHYKSETSFTTLNSIGTELHYYGQVPITVFFLNSDRKPIFDKIVSLQDAYNKLLSAGVDNEEAFVDAYMVLKGVSADNDTLAAMKENRIIQIDEEDDVSYLIKQADITAQQTLLTELNNQIQKIAKCPDFNDEKFLAQSGIAIKFKMCGMENNASNIVANMTQALQRRLELICSIQRLTADEFIWRDIEIVFTRNLPVNELEQAQLVNQLRGLVSDKTLLAQLAFVKDVENELDILDKQNKEVSIYDFGSDDDE